MKHDLTTGTWQDDTGCPISIILVATSDDPVNLRRPAPSQSLLPPSRLRRGRRRRRRLFTYRGIHSE